MPEVPDPVDVSIEPVRRADCEEDDILFTVECSSDEMRIIPGSVDLNVKR